MSRVLSTACILVVWCCFAAPATADDAKPKIAVLGLEAAPSKDTGSVDPSTTDVARSVTQELRNRARGGAGGFAIAPNSDKELTDEKILNNCDSERADCMAIIAAGLTANYLLYGKVEKKGDSYRVSLKLLDVAQRHAEQASGDLQDTKSVGTLAKKLYGKLVNNTTELVVTANAESGKVIVDEELKGRLSKGTAKITGLSEGRHTLAIEATGYERFESKVVIERGEPTSFTATLVEKGEVPEGGSWTGWRTMFYTSLIVAGVSGLAQGYFELDKFAFAEPDLATPKGTMFKDMRETRDPGAGVSESDCNGFSARSDPDIFADATAFNMNNPTWATTGRPALKRACRDDQLAIWLWFPTGIALATAAVAFYEWKTSGEEHAQTAKHARRGVDYTIVPLTTARASGMSLLVTW